MFGRKLIDHDVAEWQFDWFSWLIDNYSSGAGLPDSALVLPTDEFFQTACGTYQLIPAKYGRPREIIKYDADLENRPAQMVATFAHELSHALHNRSHDPLDIEPELYELFTDLTAIYLGYGIFLANMRFEFSQFSNADTQGWQAQGAGYLPEADMIFATALFMTIKDIPMEAALPYLKPRLQKMLKKGFRQLERYSDEVEKLKAQSPPKA